MERLTSIFVGVWLGSFIDRTDMLVCSRVYWLLFFDAVQSSFEQVINYQIGECFAIQGVLR